MIYRLSIVQAADFGTKADLKRGENPVSAKQFHCPSKT